jgi:hypothetical protein
MDNAKKEAWISSLNLPLDISPAMIKATLREAYDKGYDHGYSHGHKEATSQAIQEINRNYSPRQGFWND